MRVAGTGLLKSTKTEQHLVRNAFQAEPGYDLLDLLHQRAPAAAVNYAVQAVGLVWKTPWAAVAEGDKIHVGEMAAKLIHLIIGDVPNRHSINLIPRFMVTYNYAKTLDCAIDNHPTQALQSLTFAYAGFSANSFKRPGHKRQATLDRLPASFRVDSAPLQVKTQINMV
ncbi:MAG: hypothetical protein BMS9Abin18_0192 [Zetaproteobacteria bacterium]|nr:MAG: hypothetical protein BMS9Abin18_0192 [Zetaproteobacteria bacterium]